MAKVRKYAIKDLYKIRKCPTHIVDFNPLKYCMFVLALITNYVVIRQVSKVYEWDNRPKSGAQDLQDITIMVVLATVPFIFGNYSQTFDKWTVFGMVVFSAVYTWITNLRIFKFSIREDLNASAITILTITAIVVVSYLVYSFIGGFRCKMLKQMGIYVGVLVIVISLLFALKSSNQRIHIHHYQIGWVLMLFGWSDSIITKIFTGCVISLYVNGLAVYGLDKTVESTA